MWRVESGCRDRKGEEWQKKVGRKAVAATLQRSWVEGWEAEQLLCRSHAVLLRLRPGGCCCLGPSRIWSGRRLAGLLWGCVFLLQQQLLGPRKADGCR